MIGWEELEKGMKITFELKSGLSREGTIIVKTNKALYINYKANKRILTRAIKKKEYNLHIKSKKKCTNALKDKIKKNNDKKRYYESKRIKKDKELKKRLIGLPEIRYK